MHSQKLGHYFLLILLAGAGVLTYFIFEPFLAPLFLAAVFAVVLHPLYLRILREMPRWPSLSALITVLITCVVILAPLSLIGTQIGIEARDVYRDVRSGDAEELLVRGVHTVENVLVRYVPTAAGLSERISSNISTYLESGLQWILQNSVGAAAGVAALALKFFLFFIALYYLLRDGAKLKSRIVILSPLKDTYDEQIFDKLALAVNSVIKGNLTIALLQGVVAGIGFTIFGVPNSVLWGTVAALGALIPGVGTSIVLAPAVLFLFFTGNVPGALGLALWGVFAVGLIDNFLSPQLIGAGAGLHPFLILLSVLGGIALFGPLGIFLGPISLSLLFAFLSIYAEVSHHA